ncbi:hypothetical protein [Nocardia asiatica]|uniref:hypothetical protein n=1 Tax=Nocardia asiatica TaxID=209252 RepID=UPI0024570350|nr:hypothetical protein [Nocardia asiatica]
MRDITEAQVREALGLPAKDPRIDFEIDWNGSDFKDSECCFNGQHDSAAVHIDWTRVGFDADTDRPNSLTLEQDAFCWDHARTELAEILAETEPFAHDDDIYIKVVVNGWYVRYALQLQVAA